MCVTEPVFFGKIFFRFKLPKMPQNGIGLIWIHFGLIRKTYSLVLSGNCVEWKYHLIFCKNCLSRKNQVLKLWSKMLLVRWPCHITLTWSPYGIFLHFLLIWSKWIPKAKLAPPKCWTNFFMALWRWGMSKPKKSENVCKKWSKPFIVCTRWKGNCL